MAVRPGQDAAERNAIAVGHARAFEALLASVHRGTSGCFATARGLGDGAVDSYLVEGEADGTVVGVERDVFQAHEDAQAYPFITTVADRRRRTAGVGDRLIGAAEPEDLQQLVEDNPVADPAPVAAQRVGRIERRTLRQQGDELFPQRLGQPCRQNRHGYPR
ncbi:hypothetical protein GCM10022233_37820 [Streptomyces shaanxiensis]|uniref:GNAT family N-acetyltransferase n=1 Tax=Streptomyces shaanxiensis TaxID=653357 RepID=A0ABP7V706_9ACTN